MASTYIYMPDFDLASSKSVFRDVPKLGVNNFLYFLSKFDSLHWKYLIHHERMLNNIAIQIFCHSSLFWRKIYAWILHIIAFAYSIVSIVTLLTSYYEVFSNNQILGIIQS